MTIELILCAATFSNEGALCWQDSLDMAIAGVDRVALTGEHDCFGENLEANALPEFGGVEKVNGSEGQYVKPIVGLAMIAALTQRIHFNPNILLSALRRSVVLTKMVPTLDLLSRGRLDLGVGVGWQREEYRAAGLDLAGRGRRLDYVLEACPLLWRERRADYTAAELSFGVIQVISKPVQRGGVPIWGSVRIAGPAMRRLARFDTRWIPWGAACTLGEARITDMSCMRHAVARYVVDPDDIEVAGVLPLAVGPDGLPAIGLTMVRVPALAEVGGSDFRSASKPAQQARGAPTTYSTRFRAGRSRRPRAGPCRPRRARPQFAQTHAGHSHAGAAAVRRGPSAHRIAQRGPRRGTAARRGASHEPWHWAGGARTARSDNRARELRP